MNERIKELAEQAGMGPWGVGNGDNVSEIVEKFAKLIATDCADLARDVGTDTDPEDWALDKCYEIDQKIRDRYGVEE